MSFINNRTMHDRRGWAKAPSARLPDPKTMALMNAAQIETSTGGILVQGSRDQTVTRISIDSRTLEPGDLFFAIRGPRDDGHQHIPAAFSKGACGAVVDFQYEIPDSLPADRFIMRVENTHNALKDMAAEARRQWRGSLVGITGSVGKTTTKEFAAHVLQTEYSVYKSPGNYNNLFGLPLSIFGLSQDDHIGIFEMGMSARGEIAEMCRIALPDVGVITNVAPVHLEFFSSLDEIALAKGELATALDPHGTFIYNADDELVRHIARRFSGNKISVGVDSEANIRADEIEVTGLEETCFRVECEGMTSRAVIPVAGHHYVMNALPAIALGRHYRIQLGQIIESLRDIRHAPMRGQVLRFKAGFTLIDDSYNSNPRALSQMTETLAKLRTAQRRLLVAGEMLELGSQSPSLHYQCGTRAAQSGIDLLVAVQGEARELARGAVAGGMDERQVHFFDEAEEAAKFVRETVTAGDVLLVKGSRGVHLEKIVQFLRLEFEEQT